MQTMLQKTVLFSSGSRQSRCPAGRVPTGHRGGFTMMELMLTIGILAVALVMVSALFPIAVKQSNESYKNVVGTLICENGLAVAKTLVKQSNVDALEDSLGPSGTDRLDLIADETHGTIIISQKSQHYQELLDTDYGDAPKIITDPNYKIKGFGVLGRKVNDTYQLIIVSYQRPKDHKVVFETIGTSSDIGANDKSFTATGNTAGLIGSPIIAKSTGFYSTITAVNGNTVELDRPFGEAITAPEDFFVLVEKNASNQTQTKSPALSVLVTLTGLEN